MIVTIPELLTAAELEEVRGLLAHCEFQDGRQSAGPGAREAKHNLQAADAPDLQRAREIVSAALLRNESFRLHALPQRLLPPMFSRYDAGMRYGEHVDNALMVAGGTTLRTDLSLTLFLSEADAYQGGALLVRGDAGSQRFRLPAGGAVLYPAGFLHAVEEVTRGSRLAAVSWVQSLVRDAGQRALLAELALLIQQARRRAPEADEALPLGRVRAALMRMWAEP